MILIHEFLQTLYESDLGGLAAFVVSEVEKDNHWTFFCQIILLAPTQISATWREVNRKSNYCSPFFPEGHGLCVAELHQSGVKLWVLLSGVTSHVVISGEIFKLKCSVGFNFPRLNWDETLLKQRAALKIATSDMSLLASLPTGMFGRERNHSIFVTNSALWHLYLVPRRS